MVAQGRFRQDLYYRLSVFTIPLPALCERGDDLPMLVQHYLRRFSRELGREIREIEPEALELLRRYPWPGNIRELQGVLKQALLQATGTVLIPAFLPESLRVPPKPDAGKTPETEDDFSFASFILRRLQEGTTALSAEAHQKLDRLLFRLVLRSTNGNQVQAARVLGISRQTLREDPRTRVSHQPQRRGRCGRRGLRASTARRRGPPGLAVKLQATPAQPLDTSLRRSGPLPRSGKNVLRAIPAQGVESRR